MDKASLCAAALGLLAGAVATAAKTAAEHLLQPLVATVLPPTPSDKEKMGADPAGHPGNMPPAELADSAERAIKGEELTAQQRQKASQPLHWTMGMATGLTYALAAVRAPRIRAGRGLLAGTVLFAAAHLIALPAGGLQVRPSRMPGSWWGWEAGSHVVYALTLDTSLRALERMSSR